MNNLLKNRINDIELQKEATRLRSRGILDYTKKELDILAKAAGLTYFRRINKHELAKRLGIELPVPKCGDRLYKKARIVEVDNPDGTITTYPSISEASRALGKANTYLYVMACNGHIRIN